MTIQTTETIILDPVSEHEAIRLYEQDKGWHKMSESTIAVIFVYRSPQAVMDAVFFPSDKLE